MRPYVSRSNATTRRCCSIPSSFQGRPTARAAPVTDYIMGSRSEPERIRSKTNPVLLDHHLEWAGVGKGDDFADFGCASGEAVRAACAKVDPGRAIGLDGDVRMLGFAAMESQRLGLVNAE